MIFTWVASPLRPKIVILLEIMIIVISFNDADVIVRTCAILSHSSQSESLPNDGHPLSRIINGFGRVGRSNAKSNFYFI